MKKANISKKKILKELANSNIDTKNVYRKKGVGKSNGQVIITDTLNIEAYFIAFFLFILAVYFSYNTNILNSGAKSFEYRPHSVSYDFLREQRQVTVNDLFRFGVSTIVIDPGHGGRDPGTISPSGLFEKDIVLDISLFLRDILTRETPFNVVMTREKDESLSLSRRAAIANSSMGDLFLSIHLNYSSVSWFSGVETYVLGITDDRDALKTASLENLAENLTISEMTGILDRIRQDIITQESLDFAGSLQTSLVSKLQTYNPRIRNIGVKKAPFVVLAKVDMPGVLVEVAFLSNKRDEELLRDPNYLMSIARGIYSGIIDYLEASY